MTQTIFPSWDYPVRFSRTNEQWKTPQQSGRDRYISDPASATFRTKAGGVSLSTKSGQSDWKPCGARGCLQSCTSWSLLCRRSRQVCQVWKKRGNLAIFRRWVSIFFYRGSDSLISFAKLRTSLIDAKSNFRTTKFVFPVDSTIFLAAWTPFCMFLTPKMTLAPLRARSFAVSNPIPEKWREFSLLVLWCLKLMSIYILNCW